MCGIAGLISSDRTREEKVKSAVEMIRHRGPDEMGFFTEGNCGLGMARLSIIDVKEGHQPNFSENRKIVSIFNGEIYNYKSLQSLLRDLGHTLANDSDAEIIPHLYEKYGDDFVLHIQGMFAIAIYDVEKNKLVLARDRLGKKPLWFHNGPNSFAFCSEVKGLFGLGVPREFNPGILHEYLSFGYINSPRSAFHSVYQVKPANLVTFENGKIGERTYWNPDSVPKSTLNSEEVVEQTTSLLRNAVKERLISERPIGVFLSGGIDSSLVAAFAKEEIKDLQTFSIGFEEQDFDESRYARKVANLLGTNHHEEIVRPDPQTLVQSIAKVLDQPFADSSFLPTFILSRFARKSVVVALSGDGGDEVFGGYDRYRFNLNFSTLGMIRSLSHIPLFSRFVDEETRRGKFLRSIREKDSFSRYLRMHELGSPRNVERLLGFGANHQSLTTSFSAEKFDRSDSLKSMQLFDIHNYLPGDLLYKVDLASMANSLEVRSPFLDYRLVEFGLSLPSRYKVSPNQNKIILRRILSQYLPSEFVNRPKKGFGIPRSAWLRNELRDLVESTLLNNDAFVNQHLVKNDVQKIVFSHFNGRDYGATLWALLMLELWAANWLS